MAKHGSGTFVIRTRPEDHQALREQARLRGISLNQLCQERLNPHPLIAEPQNSPWDRFLKSCIEQWSAPNHEVIGIVVFGSAARHELREDSDIDLLLVLDRNIRPSRDHYRSWKKWETTKLFQQLKPLQHEVTPQFVSLPDTAMEAGGIWYETAIDGIILWDKLNQVSRVLRSIREAMAEGRIQRAISYGHPYWIKKKAG